MLDFDDLFISEYEKPPCAFVKDHGFFRINLREFEDRFHQQFPYTSLLAEDINSIIGGGAVRQWIVGITMRRDAAAPSDIDVYYYRWSNGRPIEKFDGIDVHYTPVNRLVRNIVCGDDEKVDVQAILSAMDFSINQCAVYVGQDGRLELMLGEATWDDLRHQRLRYTSDGHGTHPLFHLKRIGKFVTMGYEISDSEVIRMAEITVGRKDDDRDDGYEG